MSSAKRDRLAQQAKRRQADEIAKQMERAAREDAPPSIVPVRKPLDPKTER